LARAPRRPGRRSPAWSSGSTQPRASARRRVRPGPPCHSPRPARPQHHTRPPRSQCLPRSRPRAPCQLHSRRRRSQATEHRRTGACASVCRSSGCVLAPSPRRGRAAE
jgi:hypothetical protein